MEYKKSPEMTETVLLARSMMICLDHSELAEKTNPIIYRPDLIHGLTEAGIDFDIIAVDLRKYHKINRYDFIKDSVNKDSLPKEIEIRRTDGEMIGQISLRDLEGGYIVEGFDLIRKKTLTSLLDDQSKALFEKEKQLRNSERADYVAGILAYVSGDKREPDQILENKLHQEGYPVKIADGEIKFTKKFDSCLEDPNLYVMISVAPEVFGALSEEEANNVANWKRHYNFVDYRFGDKAISSLCFRDWLLFRDREDLPHREAVMDPYFLELDRELIVDQTKARDIMREITKYVHFSDKGRFD